MEVVVRYPESIKGIMDLRKRVSYFHTILILEHIKNLEIDEKEKENVLEEVKRTLKEKAKHEKTYNDKILRC